MSFSWQNKPNKKAKKLYHYAWRFVVILKAVYYFECFEGIAHLYVSDNKGGKNMKGPHA